MAEYTFRNGTWTHTAQHHYGAERLGVHKQPTPLPTQGHVYAYLSSKNYELTNHLGNVMAVVTDRSFVHASGGFATAEVVSATDYFPFGMEMPGRVFAGSGYDFGFNTQMESPEILPGHTTAMFWEYDSRIGRRWELDPKPVTGWSGYACLGDSPIWMSDMMGDTTTPILNDGTVGRTINDPGDNRQILFNGSADKSLVEGLYNSGKKDIDIAAEMRSMDRTYIGPSTREQMALVNSSAAADNGYERGFILYNTNGDNQLKVLDFVQAGVGPIYSRDENGANQPSVEQMLKYFNDRSVKGTIRMFGHTHTKAGMDKHIEQDKLDGVDRGNKYNAYCMHRPSQMNGPQDYGNIIGKNGNNYPQLIVSDFGYSIYPTVGKSASGFNLYNTNQNTFFNYRGKGRRKFSY